jgi:hypothetical protein
MVMACAAVLYWLPGSGHETADAGNPIPVAEADKDQIVTLVAANNVVAAVWGDGHISAETIDNGRQFGAIGTAAGRPIAASISQSEHARVALLTTETGGADLAVYDVVAGTRLFHVDARGKEIIRLLGFSGDGSELFWVNLQAEVVAADSATGETKWASSFANLFNGQLPAVKVMSDGSGFAISLIHSILCSSRRNEQIWKLSFPAARHDIPPQPFVGDTLSMIDESTSEISTLRLDTGRTTCKCRIDGATVLAMSSDGRRCVISAKGSTRVLTLETGATRSLESDPNSEFSFVEGDTKIIAVPQMTSVLQDAARNIAHFTRVSNKIRVFDSQDGHLVREEVLQRQM